jgi:hypothetical protein
MTSLKTCVIITAEFITEVGKILSDKKVQFSEILGLAPELLKIPKFISNIQPALAELKAGVSAQYLQDISAAVSAKFDLQNDKAEAIVEASINWIVITSSTAFEIAKIIKK